MMRKLAKVGYRVRAMYQDGPSGTITQVLDRERVIVLWDSPRGDNTRELVAFLRKGS